MTGKELFQKIDGLIQEHTASIKINTTILPPDEPSNKNDKIKARRSILIKQMKLKATIGGNEHELKVMIKLNKQGYWIGIGGKTTMVNTIDQLNEALDINLQMAKIAKEREKIVQRLRKSGMKEHTGANIDRLLSEKPWSIINMYTPNGTYITNIFEINEEKKIIIVSREKTIEPLNDKIVFYKSDKQGGSSSVKNFTKAFKKFINDEWIY